MIEKNYRVFLLEEFDHKKIDNLFKDWLIKDMVGWHRMLNFTQEAVIEFYAKGEDYNIKLPTKGYVLPYPNNLNDFISDCYRLSIDLSWSNKILSKFNRMALMDRGDIEKYNNDLLNIIGK